MESSNEPQVGEEVANRDISIKRIILPEDRDCTRADLRGYCNCAVRTGGDTLAGFVQVFGPLDATFTVEVKLEGICRTWIGSDQNCSQIRIPSATTERRFLQEVDTAYHGPSPSTAPGAAEINLPFSFVIPRDLISGVQTTDPRFLRLYPSMRFGCPYDDYPTKSRYMQPLIFYRLTATVLCKSQGSTATALQCERETVIMPTHTPDPPLYTESFKREYRLQSSVNLRRHLCERSFANLELSASEPTPLNLLIDTPRASTTVPIKVSVTPKRCQSSDIDPYNWTLVVRSYLQMRMFYSTKPFEREPTLADTGAYKQTMLRMRTTKSETREYSNLSWRMDRLSQSDQTSLPWTARMQAIVSAPKTLPPSFLSQTAALRYSIVVEIIVAGVRMSDAVIEVPVQMVRDPTALRGSKGRISTSGFSNSSGASDASEALDSSSSSDQGIQDDSEEESTEILEAPPKYRRWI